MEGQGTSVHVFTHTSYLNSILGEVESFVFVPGSFEGDRIVTFLHNQHANDLFISIYDEVPSEFITVFAVLDHL